MLDIVQQTIQYYTKYKKVPGVGDIEVKDPSMLEKTMQVFVTIYHKWEIRGSSGNIKELESSTVAELIENTIAAISKDSRFKPIAIWDVKDIKIRIDEITSRDMINDIKALASIDPVKHGVIAIKQDYSKACVILPNISPLLLIGSDIAGAISQKLWEEFNEKELIIYKITTKTIDNI